MRMASNKEFLQGRKYQKIKAGELNEKPVLATRYKQFTWSEYMRPGFMLSAIVDVNEERP